jgi:hypothetical protein
MVAHEPEEFPTDSELPLSSHFAVRPESVGVHGQGEDYFGLSVLALAVASTSSSTGMTTMKRTWLRRSARKKASSFALSGSSATEQTPLQSFQGRQLQQEERVPDVFGIHARMLPDDGFNLLRQVPAPPFHLRLI